METKNYSDLPEVETMPENTKTPDYMSLIKNIGINEQKEKKSEGNPEDILGKLDGEYENTPTMSETLSENTPSMPETLSENTPSMPETLPENTPEHTPENTPEDTPENSPEDTAPPDQGDE